MLRPIRLLLALACAAPFATGSVHESIQAQAAVTDTTYETLTDSPEQFQGSLVKFRCTFAQIASLFDPLTTSFTPERYRNFVVWGSHARLWESDVRAHPMATLYVAKDSEAIETLATLHKYEIIEVTGRVQQVSDGMPWIDVTEIQPVPLAGSFTDNALYHMEQAESLSQEGVHDLADRHLQAAQTDNIPLYGAVVVRSQRARQLAAAGHNHEAITLLQSALQLAGKDAQISPLEIAEAHALLAKIENDVAATAGREARQELLTESVRHAATAITLDPTLADAYAVLGISLAGLGRFEDARRECDNALRLRPNDAEVRWYLGRILDQQGNYDDAIQALKKAIDLTPKDARIHQAIANAYYHRGLKGGRTSSTDFDTALREDDIALRLSPGEPETIYASGKVLVAAADAGAEVSVPGAGRMPATRDMAVERFRAAIAADETFAPAHLALAELLREQGKAEDTLTQLERVVELQPDDFPSVEALANFMETSNRRDNAVLLYEQYLDRHPLNSQVRIELVRLYTASGNVVRIQQMRAQLENQVKNEPRNAAALLALAELRLATNDATGAATLADQAEHLTGQDYQLHLAAESTLGKARWQMGDVKGALAILAPIADQISDESALLALGWAYTTLNKPAEARGIADRLRTSELATARSQEFLGWSYYLTGDYTTAEQLLLAATQIDPIVKKYRLGMAIFRQGPARYADAAPYLRAAVQVDGPPALLGNARHEVADALQAIGAQAPAASVPEATTGAVPTPTTDTTTATPAAPAQPATQPDTTTAPPPAAPPAPVTAPAESKDPVVLGMSHWDADDVKGTIDVLAPLADKIDNEGALLDLAWAYVADNRLSDATAIATKLKGLANRSDAQLELQGWILYLSGDYRGAEETLRKATFSDPKLRAYRIGMAIFMQGQPRYVEARALLNVGKDVAGRKSLLGSAHSEAEQALQTIAAAGH